MSSLGSVLSIARGAMNTQQTIIQTAGNNIANVETAGYSRQRVAMTETRHRQSGKCAQTHGYAGE